MIWIFTSPIIIIKANDYLMVFALSTKESASTYGTMFGSMSAVLSEMFKKSFALHSVSILHCSEDDSRGDDDHGHHFRGY